MNHDEQTADDDCNELGRIEDQNAADKSAVDVSVIPADESARPRVDANCSIVARRCKWLQWIRFYQGFGSFSSEGCRKSIIIGYRSARLQAAEEERLTSLKKIEAEAAWLRRLKRVGDDSLSTEAKEVLACKSPIITAWRSPCVYVSAPPPLCTSRDGISVVLRKWQILPFPSTICWRIS